MAASLLAAFAARPNAMPRHFQPCISLRNLYLQRSLIPNHPPAASDRAGWRTRANRRPRGRPRPTARWPSRWNGQTTALPPTRGWSLRREVRAGGRCATRDVAELRFSHTFTAQLLQLCLTPPVKTTSYCLDSGSTCTASWPRWRCIHPRCDDTAASYRQRAERLRQPCCLNCSHALQSALTTCLLSSLLPLRSFPSQSLHHCNCSMHPRHSTTRLWLVRSCMMWHSTRPMSASWEERRALRHGTR